MKRILISIPFLFILGLMIWTVNSLITSMFIPGTLSADSTVFSTTFENIYMRIFVFSISIMLYMILFRIFIYERDEKLLRNAFNHSFPMCITDFKHNIIEQNDSYRELFGTGDVKTRAAKCYDSRPGDACHTKNCSLFQVSNGHQEVISEHAIIIDDQLRYFLVKAKPIKNSFDEVIGIIETFNEITERKELEDKNIHLIEQLRKSLSQVKYLSGMLPVCPSCKHVRDDDGYWDQIESYINDHSEVEIVHSLCPECKEIAELDIDTYYKDIPSEKADRSADLHWLKLAN